MDGAWALYEAWVLLQEGEIDAALVYCFGRSSLGQPQRDPGPAARPLLPGPAVAGPGEPGRPAGPGPHRRRQGHRGATSPPSPPAAGKDALANPKAQVAKDVSVDDAARGRVRGLARCAATPCRRSPTAPPPSCWPPGTRPSGGRSARCGSPGSTTGWRPTRSGPGTSPPRRRRPRRPRWPAWPTGRSTWPRSTPPSPTRRSSCGRPSASDDDGGHQPVGRRAGRQPDHVGRPHPHRRGGRPGSPRAQARRAVAHATSGPCLQQNLVCVLEGA